MPESPSVEAITLAKAAFSSAQGQYGLIKFSVEELVPVDTAAGDKSNVWSLKCSFYETLGSPTPSKYEALINLADKTVSIKKLGGGEIERKFTVVEEGSGPLPQAGEAAPGSSSSTPPGK